MDFALKNNPRVETRPVVVGVDADQYIEYFGELPTGQTFVIFRPEVDWGYDKFRCFIDGMEVAIASVVRYRDGGTTNIVLGRKGMGDDAHTFNFPTPFDPKAVPTFDEQPLKLHPRGEGRTI